MGVGARANAALPATEKFPATNQPELHQFSTICIFARDWNRVAAICAETFQPSRQFAPLSAPHYDRSLAAKSRSAADARQEECALHNLYNIASFATGVERRRVYNLSRCSYTH
jgi:hypothetical protein